MSVQAEYTPDFQRFLQLVDISLIQSAADARELAERTGTPLVVRERGGTALASQLGAMPQEEPCRGKKHPKP